MTPQPLSDFFDKLTISINEDSSSIQDRYKVGVAYRQVENESGENG